MSGGFDAILIGAGLNGLVCAATLGRAGRRVLLVERGPATGGEARAMQFHDGYRAAPMSLDPGWLPPAVARSLGLRLDGGLAAPEHSVSVAFDGGWLAIPQDPAAAASVLRRYSARDAGRWPAFVARLRKIAGFLEAMYQLPAPDIDTTALGELFPLLGLARKFRGLGREDMTELLRILPMAVQELVDDWFECEPLKAAIAAGGVQDIRQGPRSGGTSFVLLHHLTGAAPGAVRGRPWWRKGSNALANDIEDVARAAGVAIRTGTDVAGIVIRDDHAAGITLASGEEIPAPVVVSTLDPAHTLRRLVDPVWLDPEFLHAVANIKFRGSRATGLFALDGAPGAGFTDGVMSLTPTTEGLERAYDAAKYGETSTVPHIELVAPTVRWPDLAPHGKHVVVAHVQWVPFGGRGDAGLEARVMSALEAAFPGFGARVRHRTFLTPDDMAARYGITEGAVTHGELTLDQILFMRPVAGWGGHAMPVPGLYLGGPGTHPGPGVLGGAGWLAARRVLARKGR